MPAGDETDGREAGTTHNLSERGPQTDLKSVVVFPVPGGPWTWVQGACNRIKTHYRRRPRSKGLPPSGPSSLTCQSVSVRLSATLAAFAWLALTSFPAVPPPEMPAAAAPSCDPPPPSADAEDTCPGGCSSFSAAARRSFPARLRTQLGGWEARDSNSVPGGVWGMKGYDAELHL